MGYLLGLMRVMQCRQECICMQALALSLQGTQAIGEKSMDSVPFPIFAAVYDSPLITCQLIDMSKSQSNL